MKLPLHTANANGNAFIRGITIGTVIAAAISFLLSMGLTSLIAKGSISESSPGVYIFIIRSLSVLAGCLLATWIVKEKNLQIIGIVSCLYLLILLGVGIIMYDGSFHNFGLGLLSVILGGGIACIIKLIPQKKKYHLPKFKK